MVSLSLSPLFLSPFSQGAPNAETEPVAAISLSRVVVAAGPERSDPCDAGGRQGRNSTLTKSRRLNLVAI